MPKINKYFKISIVSLILAIIVKPLILYIAPFVCFKNEFNNCSWGSSIFIEVAIYVVIGLSVITCITTLILGVKLNVKSKN